MRCKCGVKNDFFCFWMNKYPRRSGERHYSKKHYRKTIFNKSYYFESPCKRGLY